MSLSVNSSELEASRPQIRGFGARRAKRIGLARQSWAPVGVLVAVAFCVLGLGIAPAAHATSLSMWPTFECYHHPNGTASITVDKLQVNEDGLTTFWAAHLQRWNGRGYVAYWSSKFERFDDSVFGQLEEYPISVWVRPNSYYRAVIVMATTDGRGAHAVYATPIAGRYNRVACHT